MGQCTLIEVISTERQWFIVGQQRRSQAASALVHFLLLLIFFISQNIASLFCSMCESGAKILSYHELCLQLRPSKKWLIQGKCRSMPPLQQIRQIRQRNSAPPPSGSCPCGPGGSQGLVAFSCRGFGNRDSWDLWPPGLQHHSNHRQQPIKTRSFPLQTRWKSLQLPSHHSNSCFILGCKTELPLKPLTLSKYFLRCRAGLARSQMRVWWSLYLATESWETSSWISDTRPFGLIACSSLYTGYRVHSMCDTVSVWTRQSGNGFQQFPQPSKSEIHITIKKCHLAVGRFLPSAGVLPR